MRVTLATAIGPRTEQQDCGGTCEYDGKLLAVVCDGMGGHDDGALAASLALNLILGARPLTSEALSAAFHAAHRAVRHATKAPAHSVGGGTTATAVLIDGRRAYIAHAGDSRAALRRQGTVAWLTTEHATWDGLTSFLGMPDAFDVETYDFELASGDAVILVSDGITKRLKAPDLVAPLDADAILNAATARGLKDNTTALVIEVTP